MDCGLLGYGLRGDLGHIIVVRIDELILEEGFLVPLVHALAHQAAHFLTRVASEYYLLIVVDLAVHLLRVAVVVTLVTEPCFVGGVGVVALLRFA